MNAAHQTDEADQLVICLTQLDASGLHVMKRAVNALLYAGNRGWPLPARINPERQLSKARLALQIGGAHD